jgi:hypothetical protein
MSQGNLRSLSLKKTAEHGEPQRIRSLCYNEIKEVNASSLEYGSIFCFNFRKKSITTCPTEVTHPTALLYLIRL